MEMKRRKRMLFRLPGSARTAKPGFLPEVRGRGWPVRQKPWVLGRCA